MEARMSPIGLMLGSCFAGLLLVLAVPVCWVAGDQLDRYKLQLKQWRDFLKKRSWFLHRGLSSIQIRPPPLFPVDFKSL